MSEEVKKFQIVGTPKPDWNQNDETAPDYVKNRTHWVERSFEPIEWDGNTEGRDSIDTTALIGYKLYKISDYPLSVSDYDNLSVFWGFHGTYTGQPLPVCLDGDDQEITIDSLPVVYGKVYGVLVNTPYVYVVSAYQTGVFNGLPINSIGTYAYWLNDSFDDELIKIVSPEIVTPLNEKYIPDSIARVEDIPTSTPSIIDVLELPTENINENCFYRLMTGTFVADQIAYNSWTCHCVESLPDVGEPVTTDMVDIAAYYNVSDNEAYGYIDSNLSVTSGVPIGWYTLATLGPSFGVNWGGIINSILDDPCDGALRLLLEYVNYSYKDTWTAHKTIGWAGSGLNAEIFNNPSNTATGEYSHAEGNSTTAEGYASHAEGNSTTAEGYASHAEGSGTTASGNYSHAEGVGTTASGSYSHAEGNSTTAEGYASHAEGDSSHANGDYSHAEGIKTTANGDYSHAEGNSTTASGNYSHAEGSVTTASGEYSHAEGIKTTANGNYSHAEGSNTTASHPNSHAEGNNTTASRPNSHAEGWYTTAAGRSQHTQGEFNIVDPDYDANKPDIRAKYAHIVGNGTSDTRRSNAHTLDWNGNAWFQGTIKVGGTGQDDENAKEVALKEDIPNAVLTINGQAPDENGNVEVEGGSGGSGSPADWSVNDPTAPGYVANRTHWVERSFEPIEWDGNTEGRDSIDISLAYGEPAGTIVLYKISDQGLTNELFAKASVTNTTSDGRVSSDTISANTSMEAYGIYSGDYGTFYIPPGGMREDHTSGSFMSTALVGDFTDTLGCVIPSSGTYCCQQYGAPHHTVLTADVTHCLDEAFIPDTIARTSEVQSLIDTAINTAITGAIGGSY